MISKETFVETMKRLEVLDKKMDDVDDALHALSPDFGGFYVPDTLEIVIDLLKNLFNDKDDWLGYFVYECDFLNDLEPADVLDKYNCHVDLTSWHRVYDFLIKNMEE